MDLTTATASDTAGSAENGVKLKSWVTKRETGLVGRRYVGDQTVSKGLLQPQIQFAKIFHPMPLVLGFFFF